MLFFSKLGSLGRLGNQLFQIAATIGAAKLHGVQAKFNRWEYSDFFENSIDQTLTPNEIRNTYREPHFHYVTVPYSPGLDLFGYFQSEKYFEGASAEIRNHFTFKNSPYSILEKTCSIHIRRTDYLKHANHHPFPGLDYYHNAIAYMRSEGIIKFLVFSDDISWCKQNLPGLSYSEGNSNVRDLDLMSKCAHHIIANSSFSWWGAWLNPNPTKIVIAPKIWFGSAMKGTVTRDIYCSNWIKI